VKNARTGWNASKLASERPLSKRKVHGPVGPSELIADRNIVGFLQAERARTGLDLNNVDVSGGHSCCGYHVCKCERCACGQLTSRHSVELHSMWHRRQQPTDHLPIAMINALLSAPLGGDERKATMPVTLAGRMQLIDMLMRPPPSVDEEQEP
jgi:hypothetical protein